MKMKEYDLMLSTIKQLEDQRSSAERVGIDVDASIMETTSEYIKIPEGVDLDNDRYEIWKDLETGAYKFKKSKI